MKYFWLLIRLNVDWCFCRALIKGKLFLCRDDVLLEIQKNFWIHFGSENNYFDFCLENIWKGVEARWNRYRL